MIVLPMAGLSRRFAEVGFRYPKYMLEAHGRSLFDQAVLSFAAYFRRHQFLFIARDVEGTAAFVRARCEALGIARWQAVMLDEPTGGQAETVALGLARAGAAAAEPLTVFNIDTFRPGFRYPPQADHDGFLETFEGDGSNWSFVRPATPDSDRVAETSEKRPISRFCCTGLYHFARAADFQEAFAAARGRAREDLEGGELYVAPLYNYLIARGRDIRFTVIPASHVIFCGLPDEYAAVLRGLPAY